MIVAGIGCRKGVRAAEVDAAIEAALSVSCRTDDSLTLIAIPAEKSGETGIIEAAEARGLTVILISRPDLEAASPRTVTRSARAMATMNVHSVAEAAALAGGGEAARLLGPRMAIGPVTCALAERESTS